MEPPAQPGGSGSPLFQTEMGHACEWETSMVMALAPQLVIGAPTQLETVSVHYGFEPAYRGWITKERTPTGHIGQPQFATVKKGEALFNLYANGVVTFIEQIKGWDGRSWL